MRPLPWSVDGLQTRDSLWDVVARRWALWIVGAITVVGLLLRLPSFNSSLFGDEISTYFIVTGHSLGRVLQLVHSNQETSPPLYFILAWITKGLGIRYSRFGCLPSWQAPLRFRSPTSSGCGPWADVPRSLAQHSWRFPRS